MHFSNPLSILKRKLASAKKPLDEEDPQTEKVHGVMPKHQVNRPVRTGKFLKKGV